MAKLCKPIIVGGRKLTLFDRLCLLAHDTRQEQLSRQPLDKDQLP